MAVYWLTDYAHKKNCSKKHGEFPIMFSNKSRTIFDWFSEENEIVKEIMPVGYCVEVRDGVRVASYKASIKSDTIPDGFIEINDEWRPGDMQEIKTGIWDLSERSNEYVTRIRKERW